MQEVINVRIATNGRMVLPRSVRNVLGITGAGVIVLSVDGDEVKLSSMRQSITRAQALYRAHVITDQSSAQFIEERRIEAAHDQADDEQN